MPFKTKTSWSDDMKGALLDIKHEAILKNQEGDTHNLLDIIFSSWKERHPHSKATKGSLKICLSRLSKADTFKNEQCTPTTNIIPTKIKVNDIKTVDNIVVIQKGATCTGKITQTKCSPTASTKQLQEDDTRNALRRSSIKTRTASSHQNKLHRSPSNTRKKTLSGQTLKSRMNTPPADRDIDSILHCYKPVVARQHTRRKSPYNLRKEVKQVWLQNNPISLRTIDKIIKKHENHSTPHSQSYTTSHSTQDTDSEHTNDNVPDDPVQLINMRTASVNLASEPIVKYLCYNCGRLITGYPGHTLLVAFDPESCHLSHPPVLDMFDSLGDLSYTNTKGIWTSCNNCRTGPLDLYNTCDPTTGELYVPHVLADLASP